MKAAIKTLYAKAFMVHQSGRHMNPQELIQESDRGECIQPTQRQLEA